jgi:steroid delta-isomerase-like uncharacterized protein
MTSPATATATSSLTSGDADPTLRQAYEIFNNRDFGALARYYTDDASLTVMPTGETLRGAAGVEQFMRGWLAAFSDGHIEISTLAQSGDTAVCEFRGIGTHTGPFVTPMGTLQPTGRAVNVPFCDVITSRDGRIASVRTYFDTASFARQLGA